MSDIRTRPSVSKRCGNQTQSFVEIRETWSHTSKTGWRLSQKTQKNIEESGIAYVRKVKHRSQSYSPVKERKNMITQNFNTGRLVTTKKNHPALATTLKKYIGPRTVPIVPKKCQNCDKFRHKGSQFRNRKIIKNRVRHTKSEDESDKVIRKYITIKVLNKLVRFQLHSGSDLSIINIQTWRKLNRQIIKMTSKMAQMVTGDKIKFEGEIIIPVSLNGITKKLKVFILKNTENLFGLDWFQQFNLWDQPINMFCQKVECITAEAEKIKMELKGSFPEVFSASLGKCTKIKAKFELKENTCPIFRTKQNVPFAATEEIKS